LGTFPPIKSDNFVVIATFQTVFFFLTFEWTISVNMKTSVVRLNQKDRKGEF